MIIHSDFTDFYDSVARFGVDTTCHYVRHQKIMVRKECAGIELPSFSSSSLDLLRVVNAVKTSRINKESERKVWGLYPTDALHLCGVVVCGTMYPVITTYISGRQLHPGRSGYTIESYVHSTHQQDLVGDYPEALEHFVRMSDRKKSRRIGVYKDLNTLIEAAYLPVKVGDDIHFKFKSPVVLLLPEAFTDKDKLRYVSRRTGTTLDADPAYDVIAIVNQRLASLNMEKVLHPHTAFTSIADYVSGVMGGKSPPMEEIADTVRLQKHGFDAKTSFRPGMKVRKNAR